MCRVYTELVCHNGCGQPVYRRFVVDNLLICHLIIYRINCAEINRTVHTVAELQTGYITATWNKVKICYNILLAIDCENYFFQCLISNKFIAFVRAVGYDKIIAPPPTAVSIMLKFSLKSDTLTGSVPSGRLRERLVV